MLPLLEHGCLNVPGGGNDPPPGEGGSYEPPSGVKAVARQWPARGLVARVMRAERPYIKYYYIVFYMQAFCFSHSKRLRNTKGLLYLSHFVLSFSPCTPCPFLSAGRLQQVTNINS
jgi:hypothetical protein